MPTNQSLYEPTEIPIKYLTEDLPGIGGRLKETPEDFRVTEIPIYLPAGDGKHLFVFIEKRDLSTPVLLERISRALDIPSSQLGAAGRKDKRAVTRQWLSIPPTGAKSPDPTQVKEAVEASGACLLQQEFHPHKLKTGHLIGNFFEIIVREVHEDALLRAKEILKRLCKNGLPNFFGVQRFGIEKKNVARGRMLLENPRKGAKNRSHQRFDASAFQSDLFNRYLLYRMEQGFYTKAILGDVMKKHTTGGMFHCESIEEEQARMESLEISPTGPLFGPKMKKAKDQSAVLEEEILKNAGVEEQSFQKLRKLMPGGRRILRVLLPDISVETFEGDSLRFSFTLPKGSYATVLLGEIQKADPDIKR